MQTQDLSVERWYREALVALEYRSKPLEQIVRDAEADTELEEPPRRRECKRRLVSP